MSEAGKSTRGRKKTLTDSGRKRKRQEVQTAYNKSRINVGNEYDRWLDLKNTLGVQSHCEFAKVLLDRYLGVDEIIENSEKRQKMDSLISNSKTTPKLLEWVKDVVNHYWYTAQTTNTKEEFVGMWIGLLHHVIDVHEWILPFSSSNKCEHGPLSSNREKGWLIKDSPPHMALRRVVMDKRLLNNIHYYLNCRSTAELENFQNLILMYASKRHSYRPPTYRCRNLLAALDHNMHSSRSVLTNKDGTVRYQRVFQKKSCRWSVTPFKAVKEYQYIPDLIKNIVINRLQDDVGMNQGVVLEADDPRSISSHLAPIPPPPTIKIKI